MEHEVEAAADDEGGLAVAGVPGLALPRRQGRGGPLLLRAPEQLLGRGAGAGEPGGRPLGPGRDVVLVLVVEAHLLELEAVDAQGEPEVRLEARHQEPALEVDPGPRGRALDGARRPDGRALADDDDEPLGELAALALAAQHVLAQLQAQAAQADLGALAGPARLARAGPLLPGQPVDLVVGGLPAQARQDQEPLGLDALGAGDELAHRPAELEGLAGLLHEGLLEVGLLDEPPDALLEPGADLGGQGLLGRGRRRGRLVHAAPELLRMSNSAG